MMKGCIFVALLGLFVYSIDCSAKQVSVACMMAYDGGGAPAVFKSPECPQWVVASKTSQNHMKNCQFAILQGWRKNQEDHVACNPAMEIPLLGKDGQKHVNITVAAIFDGHGGDEASQLASQRFLEYFFLHVVFNNYKQSFPYKENDVINHPITTTHSSDGNKINASFYQILQEALLRTFKDIDLEFSQEALKNGYASGSTGTVGLLVNGQLLVGYVGDSKAILCSHTNHSHQDAEGSFVRGLYAEELTRDHHPDREDEKARIEAAGGFIHVWGVPRVNGILAMTRAIGDVNLKRYGVIAEPEIISWRALTSDSSYLVVGSDGIFEALTPTDVCGIIHTTCIKDNTEASNLSSCSSLANRIVNSALERGSTDNLSAIVISL